MWLFKYCAAFCALIVVVVSFELSVVHVNDFHARFDVVNAKSGDCKPHDVCHGGFSRLYETIRRLRDGMTNVLMLNAGDNFQGTLWYQKFKWNVTQQFLNLIPTDAYTLGNHEFDDGIAGVVPFIKAMRAPCIVANMNATAEPDIDGLCGKSIVVEVDGKRIGVVGVIYSKTHEIASTGNLLFLDEVESVNLEAQRLLNEEHVFTVIVLAHCGYQNEKKIAQHAIPGISLVVGAHSHTLLYTGKPPDGSSPAGPYPTVVKRDIDGKDVLVVQASAYTRYLGAITLEFDEGGDLLSHNGQPLYLSDQLPQNDEVNALLAPYKEIIDAEGGRILGATTHDLKNSPCRNGECEFGDVITDAMVYYYRIALQRKIQLALIHPGGIRSTIHAGDITYGDLVTAMPFGDHYGYGVLNGSALKEVFEVTARPYTRARYYANNMNLLQVSGFKVVYDLKRPSGERVVTLQVVNELGRYERVIPEREYDIIIPTFLKDGGDGFHAIRANLLEYHDDGPYDLDVLERYLGDYSPLDVRIEERLTFLK